MSTTPNRLKDVTELLDSAGNVVAEAAHSSEPAAPETVSDEEAAEFRKQKLAAIRSAIDAGAYDSDELLEHAMKKMRAAIAGQKKPQ